MHVPINISNTYVSFVFLLENLFHDFFLLVQVVHVEIKNSPPYLLMAYMEDILDNTEEFPALQSRSFVTQGKICS